MLQDRRWKRLEDIIKPLESVVVAFSGGVDSTLLLRACREFLGGQVLAVTASAPFHPSSEVKEAERLAKKIGVEHLVLDVSDVMNNGFRANPSNRCYLCKKDILTRLKHLAAQRGFRHVVEGGNADDVGDYRPGLRAVRELSVRSPLKEAGLRKRDIRELSEKLRLPTWDRPPSPCLATRFPYGETITPQALKMVEQAEEFLRRLGLREVRVRHHGRIARIEVPSTEIERMAEPTTRRKILTRLKKIGYTYVTLDLQGYRAGSMNEELRSTAPSTRG